MAVVKQCDRCRAVDETGDAKKVRAGHHCIEVHPIFVATGRRTDAAGSSEDTGIALYLCEACQAAKFRQLCKESPGAVAKALEGVNHG